MKKQIKVKDKTYTLRLSTRIEDLYSIGPAYAGRLKKLQIKQVGDLLLHFPFRYEDLSVTKTLLEAKPGVIATFKARIVSLNTRRTLSGRMTITEAIVADDTSSLKAVFFNQPYLKKLFAPGDAIILAGEIKYKPQYGRHLLNPAFDKATNSNTVHLGRIVPIYPETRGISSKWLRSRIKPLLKVSFLFKDYLPEEIKESLDLINLDEAIRQIHFPEYRESLSQALKRLSFDELFLIALQKEIKKNSYKETKGQKIKFQENKIKEFVDSLPFTLTDAQKRAAWEIIQDLEKKHPMNRLLNGDVGSGKTIVAAIASYLVSLNKKQTVIMAPTEVLALQHFKTFKNLFENSKISLELLTNNYHFTHKNGKTEKKKNKKTIKSDIVIGTHSLIQDDIEFQNIALVIIDEQHRFGVKQRSVLKQKNQSGLAPHFLSMTATPIPRTLSISLYGDLDVSIIDQIPTGRRKIITNIIPPKNRKDAYVFIEKEVKKGRQIFVICPLIEKKDKKPKESLFDFDNRKAATEEYKKLNEKIFPRFRVALLHGKIKGPDKEKIMNKFKEGKIDILVSTSVIEVGVDVPNATIMMIEGSERFGLSQLHQFRGRVGRGKYQSYCFLLTDSWGEKTKARLNAIKSTNDGFKIAEADLRLRGPGDVYGERQHGLSKLRFASIFDIKAIERANREAKKLIEIDSTLNKWPQLKKKMTNFNKNIHLE